MNEKLITVGKATLATVMATSVTMSSLSSVPVFAEEQVQPNEVEETKEVIENTTELVEESNPEVVEDTPEVVEEDRAVVYGAKEDMTIPVNPNNVALGAKVTTDSNETNTLTGDKLVDGSGSYQTSRWSSGLGLGAHWAQIEFDQVYTISSVKLFWESAKAEHYTVLVSEDGQKWTTVKEDTGHPTEKVETITFDPIQAKYVKLDIQSITHDDPLFGADSWDTISLYEIQVLKDASQTSGEDHVIHGKNLALNKQASVSKEDSRMPAYKLTDGSYTNEKYDRWSAETGPDQWFYIDLGESQYVDSFEMHWESAEERAVDYQIYVSDSLSNWGKPVVERTGNTKAVSSEVIEVPVLGRYVKVLVSKISQWDNVSCREFEVFCQKEPVQIDYSVLDRELARLKEYAAQYDKNKIWELTKAIQEAEELRNEGRATQEEVNKQVENLLNKEAYVKLELYIGEVSPTRKEDYTFRKDYTKYTRASVAKLQKILLEEKLDKYQTKEVYDARREKIEKAYEALELDQEVRGGYSGYNQEAAYAAEHPGKDKDYSGEFEIKEEWVSDAEGKRKIKLTVQFKNTGYDGTTDTQKNKVPIHQLSGNASDPEIGLRDGHIMLNVKPYDPASNPFAPGISTKTCKPLPGNENYYGGFVFETMVEPGRIDVYFETKEKRKIYMPTYYFTTEEALSVNKVPTIQAEDVTIDVGSEFDPLKYATASDAEDGEIQLTLDHVIENSVNTKELGTYKVTYSVTDQAGATTTKTIQVHVVDKEKPVIHGVRAEVVVNEGEAFDPLQGVTATDNYDKDVQVTYTVEAGETVDITKPGTYTIVYHAVDTSGNEATATTVLTVNPKGMLINKVPTIQAEDLTIVVGSAFDPLKGVKAMDAEDGDLTSKVTVEGAVDVNKAGMYDLTYKVVDSQGASTSKTIQVTVQPKQALINQAPTIQAEDLTIVVGSAFDPLKGVKAMDAEDGDLTLKISCKSNVDRNKVGNYEVTYTVMDSQGATTSKTIQVHVVAKETKPEKPNTENKPNDKKDPEKGNGTNTSTQTNAKLFTSLGVSAVTLAGILAILKKKRK